MVASRVGGLPEVIDHGVTGFLHPPDDLDGMAHSVARLLIDDRMRRQFGAAAKKVAHQRYCDSAIVPLYEAFYRETIDKIAHGRP